MEFKEQAKWMSLTSYEVMDGHGNQIMHSGIQKYNNFQI
jgi:hypothetical protein